SLYNVSSLLVLLSRSALSSPSRTLSQASNRAESGKNIPHNACENETVALSTCQGLNKFGFHIIFAEEIRSGGDGKQEADTVTNADVAVIGDRAGRPRIQRRD
ncbi:hypothetical protein EDD18DRAFT_1138114, partial [Armillaria luteobubalina]